MKIKILHMYGDIMNLYGEYANIMFLQKYLEDCGAEVTVDMLSLYDDADIDGYDFYYMGSGTEAAQKTVLKSIIKYKEKLKRISEENSVMLFTGNAFETLGESVVSAANTEYEALGIGSFKTYESKNRIVGDCLANCGSDDKYCIGYINKCSVTKNVDLPLFKLDMGFGNENELGDEGFVKNNTFGTHLIGPLLVKNPHFLQMIAEKLGCEVNDDVLKKELYIHAEKSYITSVKQLKARINNGK